MDAVCEAFHIGSQATDDDMLYSFWEKSAIRMLPLTSVPMSLNDDKKSSAMKYSKLGIIFTLGSSLMPIPPPSMTTSSRHRNFEARGLEPREGRILVFPR